MNLLNPILELDGASLSVKNLMKCWPMLVSTCHRSFCCWAVLTLPIGSWTLVHSHLMSDRACRPWERSVILASVTQGESLHHGCEPVSEVIAGPCPRIMRSASSSFPWDMSSYLLTSPPKQEYTDTHQQTLMAVWEARKTSSQRQC